MRVYFFIASLICLNAAGVHSTEVFTLTSERILELAEWYKIPISCMFVDVTRRIHNSEKLQDTRDPVIPPLPDPIIIDPINITLNFELITGNIELRASKIDGLSTLVDDLKYTIFPLPPKVNLDFRVDITKFSFNGGYDTDLMLDLTQFGYPGTRVTGDGEFHANLTSIFLDLKLSVVLKSLIKVGIQDLKLDAGFADLNLFFENMVIYGEPIDYWEEINTGLKPLFDYFLATNRIVIEQAVTDVLSYVIEDCSIAQLVGIINGGDASCLKLELPIPSLPTEKPPTPTSNQPPTDSTKPPTNVPTSTSGKDSTETPRNLTSGPSTTTNPSNSVAGGLQLISKEMTFVVCFLLIFRF